MSAPSVTVLMPVYNGEKFLRESIESILNQTYPDFEFLIINDGSTDNSANIISSYNDNRIRFINNTFNKGLVNTLNEGIKLAQGKYIARMDCDDISLPQRVKKEVTILEENENISLVSSHFIMIDENGRPTGSWSEEIKFKTTEDIYRTLPFDNWIAHPTILIRTEIARQYGYREEQQGAEDWDLWLRMASDGRNFFKVNEVLLKYRVHKTSATSARNSTGPHRNKYKILLNYSLFKLKNHQFNKFDLKILSSGLINYLKHFLSFGKPNIPAVLAALFGKNGIKIYSQFIRILFFPGNYKNSIYLFLPKYDIKEYKGAFSCLSALPEQKKIFIFITDTENKHDNKNHTVIDISAVANLAFINKFLKKMLAKRIRITDKPIVIGYNSAFFYLLLRYLDKGTECMDIIKTNMNLNEYNNQLIYNFGIWSMPYAELLSRRIVIGKDTYEEIKELYIQHNKASVLLEKMVYVNNINDINNSILFHAKKS